MSKCHIHISILHESDIMIATMRTMKEGEKLGMSATDCTLCATAVSELATNIIRYADKGDIFLHADDEYLYIMAQDRGDGIEDINLAMQEGHSSGTGLGLGLSGVSRMMDSFHIESELHQGTCVKVSKRRQNIPPLPSPNTFTAYQNLDIATYSQPHPHCIVNGDGMLHLNLPPYTYIALWDVSGHGDLAYDLSQQVDAFLRLHLNQLPNQLIKKLHQHFQGSRGLVAVIARLNLDSSWLDYAGVGNVSLLHLSTHHPQHLPHRLVLQQGVIGYQIRTPVSQRLKLHRNDSIIMHSDGICSIRHALNINPKSSAKTWAKHIAKHYRAQQDDDISCLVLHYRSGVKKC
ncbi:MAG: SpoIIE family protein phosphatase [Zetaproteobacteria bacterium]|nr:SpoIIE family protein phosphatase [Zetaproteobacteria bacterium]